jgi:predicted phage terminase large subunit-like protein
MKNNQASFNGLLWRYFYPFIVKLFNVLENGTPFLENWHIMTMATYLERCVNGKTTRLIITIGPRYLKSFCASVALPIWILGRDPTAKIICVSYSDDLASHFSRLRRRALTSTFIRLLFPKLQISKKKDSEKEVVTTKGGYIYSTSISGTLTGRGCDYLIIDDPIKTSSVMSDVERKRVNDWYGNTAYSRLDNKNTGCIIIVSQRTHHDDLIGHLLETEADDWTVLEVPAIATEDQTYEIGKGKMYFRKEGEPLHAERESLGSLEKIKHVIGSHVFAAQYQQNPTPLGGILFHMDWFQRYEWELSPDDFDEVYQSWDTASGIGSDNAYSACTTWGVSDGECYLIRCQRFRHEFPALLHEIVYSARKSGANAVLIEHASSGVQILQSLGGMNINAIGIQPRGDKESRAIQITAIIEAGRVHLPEEASWLADFENEVAKFPQSKFKDQVDSMTQFLFWFQQRTRPQITARVTVIDKDGVRRIGKGTYYDRNGGSFMAEMAGRFPFDK